jgi:hypothetical protein
MKNGSPTLIVLFINYISGGILLIFVPACYPGTHEIKSKIMNRHHHHRHYLRDIEIFIFLDHMNFFVVSLLLIMYVP